jgi:hypothetical protein
MKKLTNRMMVVAAALAAVAGMASAQSMSLKVPFAFSVEKSVLPAGNYEVTPTHTYTGHPIFILRNADTRKPHLVMSLAGLDAGRTAYSDAKLVFRCTDGECALSQIWTGSLAGAYAVAMPKAGSGEKIRIKVLAATVTKSE